MKQYKQHKSNDLLFVGDGVAYLDISTRTIPNAVVVIDESDLDIVLDGNGRWRAARRPHTTYCLRWKWSKTLELMHSALIGTSADHINGDGLDNRRCNLRPTTVRQNNFNARPNRNSSSRFKGVYKFKDRPGFGARIQCDGKDRYLGKFSSEIDAAQAYDAAAIELFGEFAYLNFERPLP